jgi:hypothetical protein
MKVKAAEEKEKKKVENAAGRQKKQPLFRGF